MNERGGKEHLSESDTHVFLMQSISKYPFVIPENQMIVYSDLSQISDFLIHSQLLISDTVLSFVENTIPYFSSIKGFEQAHLSEDEMKMISNPSEIEKFILRLYEAGVPSSLVQSCFFQIELNTDVTRGLLICGCTSLPNFDSHQESFKIVCCPETSLHFESNFDFVLACIGHEV